MSSGWLCIAVYHRVSQGIIPYRVGREVEMDRGHRLDMHLSEYAVWIQDMCYTCFAIIFGQLVLVQLCFGGTLVINYNGDGACVRKYWNMNAYFEQFFCDECGCKHSTCAFENIIWIFIF